MNIGTSSTVAGTAGSIGQSSAAVGNGAGATPADPALEKAARAFEAIFLRQMIGAMRGAKLDDGLFDSSATDQFRDMADARTADEMARTGSFGIAELLKRQFAPKIPLNQQTAIRPELLIGGRQPEVKTDV